MMEERITSRKNPLLQQVKKLLSSGKARKEAGLFVSDGTKLLQEAVTYFDGLETVILSDGIQAQVPDHVRVVRVPGDVMESVSPMQSPQGALFLCRLPEGCADPYSHKVVRSSMGAVFRTPVVQTTWKEVCEACAGANIPVAVTALSDRAKDIRQADVKTMAVVIGSEGQGVRPEILEATDGELIIPMTAHCESLNAAVAASIVMWQMTTL